MKTLGKLGLIAALALASAITAVAADDPVKLDNQVADAIQMFRNSPKTQNLFDTAYGYVVFPSVGKGAAGIGAAEGRGQVYEHGAMVGLAKLTQVTVGAQLGGQSYSEVIFFENQKALDDFKDGKTAVSAGVSAAAAAEGAGKEAKYEHGVLVYTMNRNGLMFEASIGGQHFKFTPSSSSSSSPAPAAIQSSPAGSATPTEPPPAPKSTPPPETAPTQ